MPFKKSYHAPGPWMARDRSFMVMSGDVAVCYFLSGMDAQEREANMKIAAAAPDMLAALMNLENDDGTIPSHAWRLVREAINKAIS